MPASTYHVAIISISLARSLRRCYGFGKIFSYMVKFPAFGIELRQSLGWDGISKAGAASLNGGPGQGQIVASHGGKWNGGRAFRNTGCDVVGGHHRACAQLDPFNGGLGDTFNVSGSQCRKLQHRGHQVQHGDGCGLRRALIREAHDEGIADPAAVGLASNGGRACCCPGPAPGTAVEGCGLPSLSMWSRPVAGPPSLDRRTGFVDRLVGRPSERQLCGKRT